MHAHRRRCEDQQDVGVKSMNIYYDENGLGKKVCIAIGMFDGVHKAHIEILRSCAEFAQNNGGTSFAYTFRPTPKPRANGEDYIMLTTLDQKLELIAGTGIQNTIVMDFSKEYAQATPEQFIRRICKGRRIKAIFCGHDFRFGKGAEGDIDYLQEMSGKMRYRLFVTDPVMFEGEPLSSSRIRRELKGGDFELATEMLGRPYSTQMVIHSRKIVDGITYIHGVLADCYDIANGLYEGSLQIHDDRLSCEIYVYNKTARLSLSDVNLDEFTARAAEMDIIKKA